MDSCPDEMVEEIFKFLPGRDLKVWLLISKRYNRIISESSKLMGKLVLRLDCEKEFDQSLLSSTRKYSSVGIFRGRTEITHFNMEMFMKYKGRVKFLLFHDCKFYESNYTYLIDMVKSTAEEIKFVKCAQNKSKYNISAPIPEGDLEEAPPAKRMKLEEDCLKIVRLHRTFLDVGDLFAHRNLKNLEILIDQRGYFEKCFRDDDYSCERPYFKHRVRSNNATYLMELLKLLPHLKTIRLGWSKEQESDLPPEQLQNTNYHTHYSPFIGCAKYKSMLPELEHLEVYNAYGESEYYLASSSDHDDDSETQFGRNLKVENLEGFISLFPSLKSIKFKNFNISIRAFENILYAVKNLEKFSTNFMFFNDWGMRDWYKHDNLKELECHFGDLGDFLRMIILEIVPNIKKLKSNIDKEQLQKLIDEGKLPLLDTIEDLSPQKDAKHRNCLEFGDNHYSDYDDYIETEYE